MPNRKMKWLNLDNDEFKKYSNTMSLIKIISEIKGDKTVNTILIKSVEKEYNNLNARDKKKVEDRCRNSFQRKYIQRISSKRPRNPLSKFRLYKFFNLFKRERKSIG